MHGQGFAYAQKPVVFEDITCSYRLSIGYNPCEENPCLLGTNCEFNPFSGEVFCNPTCDVDNGGCGANEICQEGTASCEPLTPCLRTIVCIGEVDMEESYSTRIITGQVLCYWLCDLTRIPYSSKLSWSKVSWKRWNHANVHFRDKNFVIAPSQLTHAQYGAVDHSNFRENYFRDWMSNYEIHDNSAPRKFGAIRYTQ